MTEKKRYLEQFYNSGKAYDVVVDELSRSIDNAYDALKKIRQISDKSLNDSIFRLFPEVESSESGDEVPPEARVSTVNTDFKSEW